MRSSKAVAPLFTAVLLISAAAAQAARIDFKDPARALGREDDVRVDAQLVGDTLSSNQPIAVNYQVQNLSTGWIAVADKVASADFDADSRTINLNIGAEVPKDGNLPHMVLIAPGEKKTFTAGAVAQVAAPNSRSPFAVIPRYVQITVNFLRDVKPFKELITRQVAAAQTEPAIRLSDAQFDAWMQANDSVVLNSLPVVWQAGRHANGPTAEDEVPAAAAPAGGSW